MRLLLAFVLMLALAGSAFAVSPGNVEPQKGDEIGGGSDGREGGETFGDAVVIPGLPYTDSGATCDNVDDITLSCVSLSPDVVYAYTAATSSIVTVSLCGSAYDTGLGVFNSSFAEIACNDDFCGLQSEISFGATAGQTYYFVVDGYYATCGNYVINVTGGGDVCDATCPAGGIAENEPDCYDYYIDATNGGCNSTPQVFGLICPQDASSAQLCGTSGTYTAAAGSSRDTDWFRVYGTGGTMTATVCADFPVQLLFIYGTDCGVPSYDAITGQAGQEVSLSRTISSGMLAWIWVGPSGFTGVPCGSQYLLTMDGIDTHPDCEPSPTEESSWGRIKSQFR